MKPLRKYWYIFNTQVVNSLAYPGELIGRSLMIIPFMWIFAQLWTVTYAAGGTDSINGLTLNETMWYLMLAETIVLSTPRLANTIAESVRDGSIAYLLNKPYDFLLYLFSTSTGETVFRAVMNALFGSIVVWWLAGPPPSMLGFAAVVPAILGSWTLNFCVAAMIGLSAFVVEDVSAFQWIYQKMAFILGGLLIPLDFYPAWLQTIAKALPFSAMVYAPARLFVEPSAEAFATVLGMQIFWILVLGLTLTFFYRRGLAYLTVNGG